MVMRMLGKTLGKAAVAVMAATMAVAAIAAPPLEEEIVNPSEVLFEGGKAYADSGGGQLEPLHSRRQDGETVYYRLVRYDNEFGYVDDAGTPALAQVSRGADSEGLTPYRYYGAGHLYRPDFYNSPYNRDARQRYSGPGYFGSCSRYDGCREVQIVPLWPYLRGY